MKTEKEIKEKLDYLMQQGSKSKQAENILFTQIYILEWVLGLRK